MEQKKILWEYAQDGSKAPSFAVVPISHDDFVLFRLDDSKEYQVWDSSDTPLRPLPGMYFFDAWRINPSLTHSVVATATSSEESSLEEVESGEICELRNPQLPSLAPMLFRMRTLGSPAGPWIYDCWSTLML